MTTTAKQVEKKPGIMDKLKKYARGSWNEMKKVHWPNKSELITYTSVVLVAVVLVSTMIFIVDSALSFVLELLI